MNIMLQKSIWNMRVYPMKYGHGFVPLYTVVMFLVSSNDSHYQFTHFFEGCLASMFAIL